MPSIFSDCFRDCCRGGEPPDIFLKFTVVVESINFFQQHENISSRFTDFTIKMFNDTNEKETSLLNCLGERNIDLHADDVFHEFVSRFQFRNRQRTSREAGGRLEWRTSDHVRFEVTLFDDRHEVIKLKDGTLACFSTSNSSGGGNNKSSSGGDREQEKEGENDNDDDGNNLSVQSIANSPFVDSGATLCKSKFKDKDGRSVAEIEYSWSRSGLVTASEIPTVPIVHDPSSMNAPLLWTQVDLDLTALRGPKVPTQPFRVGVDFGRGTTQYSPRVKAGSTSASMISPCRGQLTNMTTPRIAAHPTVLSAASQHNLLRQKKSSHHMNLNNNNNTTTHAPDADEQLSISGTNTATGSFRYVPATSASASNQQKFMAMMKDTPRQSSENVLDVGASGIRTRTRSQLTLLGGTGDNNTSIQEGSSNHANQRSNVYHPHHPHAHHPHSSSISFIQPLPINIDHKNWKFHDFKLYVVLEDFYDVGCIETPALMQSDGRVVKGFPSQTDTAQVGFTVADAKSAAAETAPTGTNSNIRIFNTPFGSITATITVHFRRNTSSFDSILARNWVDHANTALSDLIEKSSSSSDGEALCVILREWQKTLSNKLEIFLSSTEEQRNSAVHEGKPEKMLTTIAYCCEAVLDFTQKLSNHHQALRVPADTLLQAANTAIMGKDSKVSPGAKYFILGYDKPALKRRVHLTRGTWKRVASWMSDSVVDVLERVPAALPAASIFPPVYFLSIALRGALALYRLYYGLGDMQGTIGEFQKIYKTILIGICGHMQDIENDAAAAQCLEMVYEHVFSGISIIESFSERCLVMKFMIGARAVGDLVYVEKLLLAAQENLFQFLNADRTKRILLKLAGQNEELKRVADTIDVTRADQEEIKERTKYITDKVNIFLDSQKQIMDKLAEVLGAQHALKWEMNLGFKVLKDTQEQQHRELMNANRELLQRVASLSMQAKQNTRYDLMEAASSSLLPRSASFGNLDGQNNNNHSASSMMMNKHARSLSDFSNSTMPPLDPSSNPSSQGSLHRAQQQQQQHHHVRSLSDTSATLPLMMNNHGGNSEIASSLQHRSGSLKRSSSNV